MKHWILPIAAVGTVVFLMSRRGQRARERMSDACGDWSGKLLHGSQRLQDALEEARQTVGRVQSVLERVNG